MSQYDSERKREYYLANRAERIEYQKAYNLAHPDEVYNHVRKWQNDNRKKYNEYMREYNRRYRLAKKSGVKPEQ